MKQAKDLTDQEKLQINNSANHFYARHEKHVDAIRKAAEGASVAPSGSDLFRPELWKAIHWNWFFTEFTVNDTDTK